ncbi:hypothetical protein [Wolbachia endosymbiont (group A) of Pogonocherus hispidulus]|uniref:hypothetical protein n=1 Tax=Wolbachia endosymbiont (group A) of Pogonocherus hispidulus TaxID=3066136 RepID=UPI00334276C4
MKITEYLQYHDKGAGGVCQGSFFVSIPKKSSLYGYARSLLYFLTHLLNFLSTFFE